MATSIDPGFLDYVKAAFFARKRVPGLGGVPWNPLFVLGVTIAGLAAPGLWLLGLGVETAYLAWMAQNDRFRALIKGERLLAREQTLRSRTEGLLAALAPDGLARHRRIAQKCEAVRAAHPGLEAASGSSVDNLHAGGLRSLETLYLRLLLARQSITQYLREANAAELERRIADTGNRLAAAASEAMKRPLQANLELLQKRLGQNRAARENLEVIDAELERLENQVDLIRDEAAVNRDPSVLSARIDAVARTIGEAGQFLKVSQELLGDLGQESGAALPAPAPRVEAAGGKDN